MGNAGLGTVSLFLQQGTTPNWKVVAEQERHLQSTCQRGDLRDRFEALEGLGRLYMRRFSSGGAPGVIWTQQVRKALAQQIFQEGRLHELMERVDDDRAFLPFSFQLPFVFTLPADIPHPKQILIQGERSTGLFYRAYFRIQSLGLIQGVVSDEKIASVVKNLLAAKDIPIITLSHDRNRDLFWVDDGYNRLFGAWRAGYEYILARVLYKYPMTETNYSLEDIRVIPHTEYQRLAQARQSDGEMCLAMARGASINGHVL